jgi:hypothetical protein
VTLPSVQVVYGVTSYDLNKDEDEVRRLLGAGS